MAEPKYGFKFLAPVGTASLPGRVATNEPNLYASYLTALQKLRAMAYLRDGAIQSRQVDSLGRFRMDDDALCWHLLLVDMKQEVIGCAKYLLHPPNVSFEDLRIRHNLLFNSPVWGGRLRRAIESELQFTREQGLGYVELGGWAIAHEYRNTKAALETLLGSYAWAEIVGHCVCTCTATIRNHSSSILRRIGGTPVMDQGVALPPYFDAQYGCSMELIRFDSRQLPARFGMFVEQMRSKVSQSFIIRASTPEETRAQNVHNKGTKAPYSADLTLNKPSLSSQSEDDVTRSERKRPTQVRPIFTRDDLVAARKTIPFSPGVALRALSVLRDPLSSLGQMEDIVAKDPVIAAHLIRLANSGLYNRGREVRSISDALMLLGTHLVTSQVMALTLRKAYSAPQLRKIWDHSVEAAQISVEVCKHIPNISRKEVMLAALVHDIGKIVLVALGESFERKCADLVNQGHSSLQAETILCGINHAEIGGDLLESWAFPIDLAAAVRYHHSPSSERIFADILYVTELVTKNDDSVSDAAEYKRSCDRLRLAPNFLSAGCQKQDPEFSMLCFAAAA